MTGADDARVLRGSLVTESFARQALATGPGAQPAREADARARACRAYQRWWRRHVSRHGPASGARLLHETGIPLLQLLGYRRLAHTETARPSDVAGLAAYGTGARVAVLTAPWNADLDRAWREAVSLGTSAQVPWCLAFNGVSLRVVDAARPFARRHVEIDLAAAAAGEPAFALLWLVARAAALTASPRGDGLSELAAASAGHQALVCAALDRGVRQAYLRVSDALLRAARSLRSPPRRGGWAEPPAADQALTIVFRLLFLLYVESRGLAPMHHPIYRDGYSVGALGETAVDPRARGLWPAVKASMRLAHTGCRVRGLEVTAYNGRLFSPDHAPLAERARLGDDLVREVIEAVATRRDRSGRAHPVPYAELGVEQLGAIYERLMDVSPVGDEPRTGGGPSPGRARKTTGSFYTPRSLTDFVVRRTLAPLVVHRRSDEVLGLRVLDPAMGSGAFLVSACRYLAAAYEQALVAEGDYRPSDFTPRDRAGFRRLVAQRCLYGVDLNPTAVQLARLSLWLTTLAADRPLTFLDHRLQAGDSLVGASPADIARQPPGRGARRKRPDALPLLAGLDMLGAMRTSVGTRLRLAATPDDDAEVVRTKERTLRALDAQDGPLAAWRAAADTWCSAWFWPDSPTPSTGVFNDLVAAALGQAGALRPAQRGGLVRTIRGISARHRFFHWTLAFPEVFADAGGATRDDAGFDAIVGNPPWDMLRAEDGADTRTVRGLVAFVRESGLYTAGGDAHANRFHLFVERALDLLRPGGRLGFITPWGLLGDAGAAHVRRRLLERAALDAVVVFDNRRSIFPIHRSITFVASTCTRGPATRAVALRPAEADASALDAVGDLGAHARDFPVTITRAALERLAPADLACPAVRSPADLTRLLRLAQSFPAASDPAGWGLRFGRELNATDDRHRFARGVPGCPIVEGKHLAPFAVQVDASGPVVPRAALGAPRVAEAVRHARVAYRDVASPGNRLTLIAAVLPAGVVTTHTVCVAKTRLDGDARQVVCALLNSLVANWYVRHWVSVHVTAALMHRLPLPCPSTASPAFAALATLARRCAAEGTDGEAYVRLQAECARLYGLDRADLQAVLDTFPLLDESLKRRIGEELDERRSPAW